MTFDDALRLMAALTPVVLGVLTYVTAKANASAVRSARNARHAAERVETTLAETTGQTAEKLGEIHTLVNSRLTEALAKIDRLEAALYDVTGEAPTGEPAPNVRPAGDDS